MPAQAQAYLADGTPIPEERLASAVNSGLANFRSGAIVSMVDATGVRAEVPAEEVGSRLDQGFQIESPSLVSARPTEVADLPTQVGAGAAGALRGLSFGASDVVLPAFVPGVSAEDARAGLAGMREAAPVASLAGETVGAVAPLVLSGGTSAAARGVSAAGALPRGAAALGRAAEGAVGARTATGRALSAAAGGAVEGSAYGLGAGISDVALHPELQDPEKAAQYLLSSVVAGAILGGGVGAGVGGLAAGAEASLAKVTEALQKLPSVGSMEEIAENIALSRTRKALTGNYQKYYDDLAQRAEAAGAPRVERKVLDAGIDIRNPGAAEKQLGSKVDDALSRLEQVTREVDAKVDVRAVIRRGEEQITKLRAGNTTVEDEAAEVVSREIERLRRVVDPPQPADMGVTVRRGGESVPLARPGKEYSVEEWWSARRKLDELIGDSGRKGKTESAHALRELRRSFEDELETTLDRGGTPEQLSAWKLAKEDYGDFLAAKKAVGHLARARAKNRTFSLTDYLAGGGPGALIVGALTGSPLAAGGAAMAQAGSAIANKLFREQGSAVIAQIADRIAKSQKADRAVARALVEGPKTRPLPLKLRELPRVRTPIAMTGKKLVDAFTERVEAVEKSRDPEHLGNRVAEAIKGAPPEIAFAVAQQATSTSAFLQGAIPRGFSRIGRTLTPRADLAMVPEADMKRFLRVVQAIEDPESVIEDLGNGKLDLDQVRALRAVAPKRWDEIRAGVIETASERDDPLPYNQRILLGLAFDFVSDPSLEPSFASSLASASLPPAPPPRPSAITPKQSLNQAKNLQTSTERIGQR